MEWKSVLDIIVTVIEVIISIPLLLGLLLFGIAAIFFCIDIILRIIRLLLKPFGIELNIGNLVIKLLDFVSSVWSNTKKLSKRVWGIIQIIVLLIIVFLLYFGIPILDKCTNKSHHHSEEEAEEILDDTPPRGVPSRYW
jgi:hypothetical protein